VLDFLGGGGALDFFGLGRLGGGAALLSSTFGALVFFFFFFFLFFIFSLIIIISSIGLRGFPVSLGFDALFFVPSFTTVFVFFNFLPF
jgi:hypothetical protein